MKHRKIIVAVFIFAAILTSCSKDEKVNADDNSAADVPKKTETSVSKGDTLVFSATDLDGQTVTNELFSKYDITLVNVWGTFCGPCKAELPNLEAVYKEYSQKNCNVIALTVDLSKEDESTLDLAKEIWKDSGCTFKALYSVPEFYPIYENLAGVPTSFFVDKTGSIVPGSFHTGALNTDGFKKFFEENLKKIK